MDDNTSRIIDYMNRLGTFESTDDAEIRDLTLYFLRYLFAEIPHYNYYKWDPNEDVSKIFISSEYSRSIEKLPCILAKSVVSETSWMGFNAKGFGSGSTLDDSTDNVNRIDGNISIVVGSRSLDELENLLKLMKFTFTDPLIRNAYISLTDIVPKSTGVREVNPEIVFAMDTAIQEYYRAIQFEVFSTGVHTQTLLQKYNVDSLDDIDSVSVNNLLHTGKEYTTVDISLPSGGISDLQGCYWKLHTVDDGSGEGNYYIWYNEYTNNTPPASPPTGYTEIKVDFVNTFDVEDLASATKNKLYLEEVPVMINITNNGVTSEDKKLILIQNLAGEVTDAEDEDTGFDIEVEYQGS